MTRTPRLVTAALVLAGATGALATLLWLAPAPERDQALRDPDSTGSLAGREPGAAPQAEADPETLAATPDEVAPAAVARPEPGPSPAAAPAAAPAPAPAPPGFAAIRDGETLRLVGAVPDEADRAAILVAARARFVAEPVIDELRVVPDAQPAPAPVASLALAALARLAEGEARLADNALALEGRALYAQATERIEDEMRLRLPEGWVAKLQVEAPEPAPEPILAPLPSGATAAAAASAGDEPAAPPPEASGVDAETAVEPDAEAATRSVGDAARPPRPQRAPLAEIALHPLPPRR